MALPHLSRALLFLFNDPPTTYIYTLSLHDALPSSPLRCCSAQTHNARSDPTPHGDLSCSWLQPRSARSEEHTSELQSRPHLVCRLLLEKKNILLLPLLHLLTIIYCNAPFPPLHLPV